MKNGKKYRLYVTRIRRLSRYGTMLSDVCPECGKSDTFYYDRFDAVCCLFCDEWLEKACSDPLCTYCSKRPDKPSEALFSEEIQYDTLRKDNLRIKYQRRYSGKLKHENQERKLI